MDLRALGDQRIARQHHLVFPAVEAGEAPIRALVYAQAGRVALARDRACPKRGLQFAVPTKNAAIAPDEQEGVVDGAQVSPTASLQ
jgi:hypothetical protein